ncbi:uncharacterized protein EV154DRAFT_548711 [Mucor mucedo]|uniref:uncharacterized protein n=1 Tax=Mucor mucedo TaxID=29922 RepID=UPI00222120AB|nr:uncharacterized protein EV154DRAFT_548711 [Mucor mucedo]KAI7894830.1 hypothetical protein EV154DRAFT_548711 [Mucor mucedo]
MLTCYISDPSLESGTCCLNIFSKSFETLEAFRENRIVKMTNFYVKEFNNNPQITLNSFSKYALFTATEIRQIELVNMNLPAAPNDKAIMKALDTWNAEASGSEAMVWVPTKRPLLETSQLYDDPSKYFDFVGQIVDIKNFDAFTLLVLTDFTENPYPPTLTVDQKVLDPKYLIYCSVWDNHRSVCADLGIKDFVFLRNCVKKLTDTLEFNIHGSNNQSKPQVVRISRDDDLLKNVLARRESVKANLKRCIRDQLKAYPLRTEFITKKRGGLKSLKYIKSRRGNGVCEVKASICKYSPQDVRDWIQGYCFRCNVRSPTETGSRTRVKKISYANDFAWFLLTPLLSRAHRSEAQFNKLKRIVHLAADTANVFFDFCVGTVDGQSCIVNTRFILEEDE